MKGLIDLNRLDLNPYAGLRNERADWFKSSGSQSLLVCVCLSVCLSAAANKTHRLDYGLTLGQRIRQQHNASIA